MCRERVEFVFDCYNFVCVFLVCFDDFVVFMRDVMFGFKDNVFLFFFCVGVVSVGEFERWGFLEFE